MEYSDLLVYLSSYVLRIIGILVAGFGLIGDRFFNYTPLQTLARILPNSLGADILNIPFLRKIYFAEELQPNKKRRYNRGDIIVPFFFINTISTILLSPIYIGIPLLYKQVLPIFWAKIWFAVAAVIIIVSGIIAVIIEARAGIKNASREKGVKRFAKIQARYWFYTPLVGMAISVILLLFIVMHCFAWASQVLPTKYKIDLSSKKTRQVYYAIYSILALIASATLHISVLLRVT